MVLVEEEVVSGEAGVGWWDEGGSWMERRGCERRCKVRGFGGSSAVCVSLSL